MLFIPNFLKFGKTVPKISFLGKDFVLKNYLQGFPVPKLKNLGETVLIPNFSILGQGAKNKEIIY
jgi:hypothetical protein